MAEAMEVDEEDKKGPSEDWIRWSQASIWDARDVPPPKRVRSLDPEEDDATERPRETKRRAGLLHQFADVLDRSDEDRQSRIPEEYHLKAPWGGLISRLYHDFFFEGVDATQLHRELEVPAGVARFTPARLFTTLHHLEATTALEEVVHILSNHETSFTSQEVDYLDSPLLYGLCVFARINRWVPRSPQAHYFNHGLFQCLQSTARVTNGTDYLGGRNHQLRVTFVDSFQPGRPPGMVPGMDEVQADEQFELQADDPTPWFDDRPRDQRPEGTGRSLDERWVPVDPFGLIQHHPYAPQFDRPRALDSLRLFPVMEFLLARRDPRLEIDHLIRQALYCGAWPSAFQCQFGPWLIQTYPDVFTRTEVLHYATVILKGRIGGETNLTKLAELLDLPSRPEELNREFIRKVAVRVLLDWMATFVRMLQLLRLPDPPHRSTGSSIWDEAPTWDQAELRQNLTDARSLLRLLLQHIPCYSDPTRRFYEDCVRESNLRPYLVKCLDLFKNVPDLQLTLGNHPAALRLNPPTRKLDMMCICDECQAHNNLERERYYLNRNHLIRSMPRTPDCTCFVCTLIVEVIAPKYFYDPNEGDPWLVDSDETEQLLLYARDTLECDLHHHNHVPLWRAAKAHALEAVLFLYQGARHTLRFHDDVIVRAFLTRHPVYNNNEEYVLNALGQLLVLGAGATTPGGQPAPMQYNVEELNAIFNSIDDDRRVPQSLLDTVIQIYVAEGTILPAPL